MDDPIRELIELDAVNETDDTGRTALFYVISSREVQTLIDAGADINITDNQGKTPLIFSLLYNKNVEVLRALIDAGVDVNIADGEEKTALLYAVQKGKHESVVHALIDAGAEVNRTDNDGKTALFYAVMSDNITLARLLIEAGTDVNITENLTERIRISNQHYKDEVYSTMIKAFEREKPKVFISVANVNKKGYLIESAPENNKNQDKTALVSPNNSVTDDESDAEFDTTNDLNKRLPASQDSLKNNRKNPAQDKTALFYAVSANMVDLLKEKGAELENTDNMNNCLTPLQYTLKNNRKIAALALIEARAKVNVGNSVHSPLFYAVMYNSQAMVHKLVPAVKNTMEVKTALDFALEYRKEKAAQALLDASKMEKKSALSALFKTQSISFCCQLIENGTKLLLESCDEVLAFFVECIFCRYSAMQYAVFSRALDLLQQHGVDRKKISDTILNVFLSKILSPSLFARENHVNAIEVILELARNNLTDQGNLGMEMKGRNAPEILEQLPLLGVNPNSADTDGNTALHHLTRLPFLGVPKDVIIKIYSQLKTFGVPVNASNKQLETPLLFCLSGLILEVKNKRDLSGMNIIVDICKRLLEDGANIQQTTRAGESVFHLVMELFRHGLVQDKATRENVIGEAMKLLELLSSIKRNPVNSQKQDKKDESTVNTPLHLWASFSLEVVDEYDKEFMIFRNLNFRNVLEQILKHLKTCGKAKVGKRNARNETPLPLCRTWAAVELLLEAGASNLEDLNSRGCRPLLAAAKEKTFLKRPDHFYPDVSGNPTAFWRMVLKTKLDLWAVDEGGVCLMSILVGSREFILAKALLEVAHENKCLLKSENAVSLLNAICKDTREYARWKSILVEIILKSNSTVFRTMKKNEDKQHDTPIVWCTKNFMKFFIQSSSSNYKSVHWKIANQLLWYGADPSDCDSRYQTCLAIAKKCPTFRYLLKNIDKAEPLIRWHCRTQRYKPLLEKVVRCRECNYAGPFWYYETNYETDHVALGSLGAMFVGINETDGREVAIKRVRKNKFRSKEFPLENSEDLTALVDSEHVVRYVCILEEESLFYVVAELMEGNLGELLAFWQGSLQEREQLCQNVIGGLEYLHQHNIIHRCLKISNILYKLSPKLCLKVADFGLVNTSSTYNGTNNGTRCWIAPEILTGSEGHSKSSDIFSCGLILHYILSERHPFAPSDRAYRSLPEVARIQDLGNFWWKDACPSSLSPHPLASLRLQIQEKTVANVIKGEAVGWDSSSSPEGAHLVGSMLSTNKEQRPSGTEALVHPLFWSKKKKLDLLIAVGNQPEFECPRAKRTPPLTAVENDLEASFGTIVKYANWNDPGYAHMPAIYAEMTRRRRAYDTHSVVELVRFVRNAYAHVSESTRPTAIRNLLLQDFVFLEYFPNLVMEVYKAVTTHGWDQTREEVVYKIVE